jgi:hypothetical protein
MKRNLEDIKKIVGALLNDSGRTPEEAELAADKAAQLLARSGLTLQDVVENGGEDIILGAPIEVGRHPWIVFKFLLTPISRLTQTEIWFNELLTKNGNPGDRKSIAVVGYDADVEWAKWLIQVIETSARQAIKGVKTDPDKRAILIGVGVRLRDRINLLVSKMDRAIQEQGQDGKAVVLHKSAQLEQWIKELGIELAPSKNRGSDMTKLSGEKFKEGLSKGDRIALGRPIEGNKGVLQIEN